MGKDEIDVAGDLIGDDELLEGTECEESESTFKIQPRGAPTLEELR